MYRKYFGLNALPFKTTPDLEMFYKHGSRQEILDALIYTITRGDGILKVTGEVGSGKTMLLRLLANSLPADFEVIYINSPNLSAKDILLYICTELGIQIDDHSQKFLLTNALKSKLVDLHAQGKKVVMLVDEAQSMTYDALEEVRLLSNIETDVDKLLQIVLFGQPELDIALENEKIRQLKSRITYNILVPPFTVDEVQSYLNYRMRKAGYSGLDLFDKSSAKRIHKLTYGLPRNINVLADKILMSVFGTEDTKVKGRHFKNLPEVETPAANRNMLLPYILVSFFVLASLIALGWNLNFIHFNAKSDADPELSVVTEEVTVDNQKIVIENNPKQSDVEKDVTNLTIDPVQESVVINGSNQVDVLPVMQEKVEPEVLVTIPERTPSKLAVSYKMQDPLALLNNETKLNAILTEHSKARDWLQKVDERYVIQLSTRHLGSLESTIRFYNNQKIDSDSIYILIDFNKNVQKYRLKVFYTTSSSFSKLNQIIDNLPLRIRRSNPYVATVEQLVQNLRYTDKKLQEVGIIHEETNNVD